jgi:hypothetical protein
MDRQDVEIWRAWGQLMALEVALTAVIKSHPDPEGLRSVWRGVEDLGFTWTTDAEGVGQTRLQEVQGEYVSMLDRLRAAAGVS